jgi:hypothetical protein
MKRETFIARYLMTYKGRPLKGEFYVCETRKKTALQLAQETLQRDFIGVNPDFVVQSLKVEPYEKPKTPSEPMVEPYQLGRL